MLEPLAGGGLAAALTAVPRLGALARVDRISTALTGATGGDRWRRAGGGEQVVGGVEGADCWRRKADGPLAVRRGGQDHPNRALEVSGAFVAPDPLGVGRRASASTGGVALAQAVRGSVELVV